jgi:pimeloyl-ACP methyl ester carboxylesterase
MPKIPRDLRSSVIRDWSTGAPAPLANQYAGASIKAVVFVHGILSDHTTYANCHAKLAIGRLDWKFYYVDYDSPLRTTADILQGPYVSTLMMPIALSWSHTAWAGSSHDTRACRKSFRSSARYSCLVPLIKEHFGRRR